MNNSQESTYTNDNSVSKYKVFNDSLEDLRVITKPIKQSLKYLDILINALHNLNNKGNEIIIFKYIENLSNVRDRRDLMKRKDPINGYCPAFYAIINCK